MAGTLLPPEERQKIQHVLDAGLTQTAIAAVLGRSPPPHWAAKPAAVATPDPHDPEQP
ncbi:helix-turn-helix domain-containing protein [Amycolatopsis sp. NPDC004625]|uniref:helix-turn-helix domain-containing protein n=1 Tax=Amycolatopsis sp. NPDC004625 TaxID=3154670 RepID=UPI0033BC74C3